MIIHIHTSTFTFTPHQPNAGTVVPAFGGQHPLAGPRNEYLVELEAKHVECMNVVKAQQGVLEMQQNEMETLQTHVAELAARLEAVLARGATLQAAPAVAPPIDPPAQPPTSMVSHESPPTCT